MNKYTPFHSEPFFYPQRGCKNVRFLHPLSAIKEIYKMRNHLLKKVAQKVAQISAQQGYICCSVMHTEKRKNPITTSFSCSYGIFSLVTRTGIEPVLPP